MMQSPFRALVSPTFIRCSSVKNPKCSRNQYMEKSGSRLSLFSERTRDKIT